MNAHLKSTFLTLFCVVFASTAWAQTQSTDDRSTDETAPRAASSPHQRESTSTEATEAAPTTDTDPEASSSPHQRQTTRTATGQEESQIMSCMKRMQASNDALTDDQARKTCQEQMRKQRQRDSAG